MPRHVRRHQAGGGAAVVIVDDFVQELLHHALVGPHLPAAAGVRRGLTVLAGGRGLCARGVGDSQAAGGGGGDDSDGQGGPVQLLHGNLLQL